MSKDKRFWAYILKTSVSHLVELGYVSQEFSFDIEWLILQRHSMVILKYPAQDSVSMCADIRFSVPLLIWSSSNKLDSWLKSSLKLRWDNFLETSLKIVCCEWHEQPR